MLVEAARKDRRPGAVVTLGGLVVLSSAWLPWYSWRARGVFTSQIRGVVTMDGRVAAVCGAIIVVSGVWMLLSTTRSLRSGAHLVAILFGLVAIVLSGYRIARQDAAFTESIRTAIERETGRDATDAHVRRVKAQFRRLGISLSLGPGVFSSPVGGAFAVVGGVLSLVGRRRTTGVGGRDGWMGRGSVTRGSALGGNPGARSSSLLRGAGTSATSFRWRR